MKLTVTSRYRNGETSYEKGQVIDVPEALGEFLLRDSPGSFSAGKAAPEEGATATGVPSVDRRQRGGNIR